MGDQAIPEPFDVRTEEGLEAGMLIEVGSDDRGSKSTTGIGIAQGRSIAR